jgi:Tfp pilus assembly protein PilN
MSILSNYLRESRIAGVEMYLASGGITWRCVLLKRSGNKVITEKVSADFSSLQELSDFCGEHVPVVLAITGKGVIMRIVPEGQASDPWNLLRKVLPDISAADFFWSLVPLDKERTLVAVVRKNAVQIGLQELQSKFSFIQYGVGAGVLQQFPAFETDQTEVTAGNYKVELKQSSLTGLKHMAETDASEINFGTEKIPARVAIACAAALKGILHNLKNIPGVQELQEGSAEDFRRDILLRTAFKAALVGLLIVLSGNYFAFNHYRNQLGELENDAGSYKASLAELDALEKETVRKKTFLTDAGLYGRSSMTWYVDQLAHGMPQGIQLSRLEFSPLKQLPAEDTLAFESRVVRIQGLCTESGIVNDWIATLQKTKWITHVQLQSYVQAQGTGTFHIELEVQ